MFECLNQYSSAIIAIATIVQALATVVLVLVTRRYVKHTSEMVEDMHKQREDKLMDNTMNDVHSVLGLQGTKQCPACHERIKKEAKKCRYCNEWIEGSERKGDAAKFTDN